MLIDPALVHSDSGREEPTGRRRRFTRARRVLLIALAVDLVGTVLARARGYAIGVHTLVRCRRGHVFTTIWIPGASVKAIRLGWWRVQRCPAGGGHWSLVLPVREADLSARELRAARAQRDLRVP